jgi:hypothetical protein
MEDEGNAMGVTIEIPIPDELVPTLDRKAREAGLNREEYVKAVVSRDLSAPRALDEVLAPFPDQVTGSGISDAELIELFSAARDEAHRKRKP